MGKEFAGFFKLLCSVLCALAVVILKSAVLGFCLLIDKLFGVFPVAGGDVALLGYLCGFVLVEVSFTFQDLQVTLVGGRGVGMGAGDELLQ